MGVVLRKPYLGQFLYHPLIGVRVFIDENETNKRTKTSVPYEMKTCLLKSKRLSYNTRKFRNKIYECPEK